MTKEYPKTHKPKVKLGFVANRPAKCVDNILKTESFKILVNFSKFLDTFLCVLAQKSL